jgi:hypothetical protein
MDGIQIHPFCFHQPKPGNQPIQGAEENNGQIGGNGPKSVQKDQLKEGKGGVKGRGVCGIEIEMTIGEKRAPARAINEQDPTEEALKGGMGKRKWKEMGVMDYDLITLMKLAQTQRH